MRKKSFLMHLEELRILLINNFIFFIFYSVISYLILGKSINLIINHFKNILLITFPFGYYLNLIKFYIELGFILIIPRLSLDLFFYYKDEKQNFVFIIIKNVIFFIFLFLFYYLSNKIEYFLKLLTSYSKNIIFLWSFNNFLNIILLFYGFIVMIPLGFLILFKVNIKRRYFYLFSFIIGAIITPPDVLSQLIFAFSLIIIYEFVNLIKVNKK